MLQNALPALGLLLLMVLVAVALQRWRRHLPGMAQGQGPALRVMNSLALGPQQRVVTLAVGEGAQRQCLVLGVSPGAVNTLHQLPWPQDTAEPGAQSATNTGAFSNLLNQMKKPHGQP